jgi:xanthine dehydrogenase YagS FAD-binding subunit
MRPFEYQRAYSSSEAIEMASSEDAVLIAGGTDFLPLWRAGVYRPRRVVDISRIASGGIEVEGSRLKIGAMCRMGELADSPLLREHCPMAAEALLASAAPQVRNRATVGGNLMQRTRCAYFRAVDTPCNKREPNSGCGAIAGEHRLHAVFGVSAHCVATHSSDLAVALTAADAQLTLRDSNRERRVPISEFYLCPNERPQLETVLSRGEMIVSVDIPISTLSSRSRYVKIRDRASFEFAVVSVAAAIEVLRGRVRDVRLAAGGVGTIPWRLRAAEQTLLGSEISESAFRAAAERAADGAVPLVDNRFKIDLLQRLVLRTLSEL